VNPPRLEIARLSPQADAARRVRAVHTIPGHALRLWALVFLLLSLAPQAARAHPHVWTDVASEVVFDDKGRITAIRHHWLFDEAFSAFALQGLDADRDGFYSEEELEPLAQENVESLSDYAFFTFLSVGGYQAGFDAPRDYYLELFDDRLLLHFTLPLAQPFSSKSTIVLEVYDPEYYVDFSLPKAGAVRLVDAPEACRVTVHPAAEPDAAAAAALATIGADQRELPPEMKALAAGLTNSAEIKCGPDTPQTAGEAADVLAGGSGDLTALPAAPETNASTLAEAPARSEPAALEAPPAAASPSLFARFMAQIVAWQTKFNLALTAGLKELKSGGAFWWLGGVSFLYGIVHAAGPGHGKVVISSYLLANEARVRRGVEIAFLAALAQAVVAVALIGVMAVVLNMTSMAITGTAKLFEAGSFALVALLGVYLLVRKGREAWAVLRGGDAHAHHHHHHDHGHGHDHAHDQVGHDLGHGHGHQCAATAPAKAGEGLSGAAAAIFSVGLRPCSGALVVLVFALSQGVFWAGVASTFVMAVGTAITVAALAALAVGAKGIASRLAGAEGRRPAQVMLGLEIVAALFITAMGAVLFAGALQA
jgi:ABC-type nickel/cobalt efflux system permease component RcnA/ABC-type uncharacterized transport system substrate-binding protein